MKVLVTGGHVTPALACIDVLISKKKQDSVVFVGRKYSEQQGSELSFEYQEITARNIPFFHLDAGRFTRSFSLRSLFHLLKAPGGFLSAYFLVKKVNPDIVLTFGGYIGLPVSVAAFFMRKKVVMHEQTIHPGLANRLIATFAYAVFTAFEESLTYLPKKSLVVGNPIRSSIFSTQKKLIARKKFPVIYITGGSLGSHAINTLFLPILSILLKSYIVIHQCGNVREFDDEKQLSLFRDNLSESIRENYILRTHILDDEIGSVYADADLIVARAGANTFFELIALKKPAILIPLPISAHGEQQKHAQQFKQIGGGEIFDQSNSPEKLLELIQIVMKSRKTYVDRITNSSFMLKTHAAETIIGSFVT